MTLGVLAALAAVAIVTHLWLTSLTSPGRAAAAWVGAVGRNDAAAIASAMQIRQSAQTGFGAPPVIVASRSSVAAMLALPANRHQPRTNIEVTSVTGQGATAVATVAFDEAGGAVRQTLQLAQDATARRFLSYPAWRVIVAPARIRLQGPIQNATVDVDSTPVAVPPDVAPDVLVVPGRQRIDLPAAGPFSGDSTQIDATGTGVTTVTLHRSLAPGAPGDIAAAVKSALTACAASASPLGCPQSDASQGARWQVVGDPVAGLTADIADTGDIRAEGHYVMTETVADSGGAARHRISSGPYQATLAWSGTALSVQGISSSSDVPPAPRPAGVTDDAVIATVQTAFQACAAVTTGSSPDCPQSASAFGTATNVKWSLTGGPTTGAAVSFDGDAAIFTVKGNYSMHLSYDDPILGHVDADRPGAYIAYAVSDGTSPTCIYVSSS